MKKQYTAPTASPIRLYWEEGLAQINLTSGEGKPTLDSEEDILSNKKENPIWGTKSNSGMWDEMK